MVNGEWCRLVLAFFVSLLLIFSSLQIVFLKSAKHTMKTKTKLLHSINDFLTNGRTEKIQQKQYKKYSKNLMENGSESFCTSLVMDTNVPYMGVSLIPM